MRRLNLFAKGNVDVRDSLLFCRVGDEVQWNGINELVRRRHPDLRLRVRHETCSRIEALDSVGQLPAEVAAKNPPLGAYTIQSQYQTKLFEQPWDVVVLSIQPQVMNEVFRHKRDGYLFYPYAWPDWPTNLQDWLRDAFEDLGRAEIEPSMQAIEGTVARLRELGCGEVLVYNMSPVAPAERIRSYAGVVDDSMSVRVRRFNLALIELSARIDLPIVDVAAVVARAGAQRVQLDYLHLTAEGYQLVAEEVLNTLAELGVTDSS